ncbi:TetR/AcrR family transcriptional regulator C-terminal domain-containing protein [Streptomyces sp. MBT65]|uniref:TetR/AcrR family transcriptional regulator C-terminal domain-containing protein n=1 Tax=Streptomyces sp. MBT65 TaxID=1488395 RepID=UPI00190B1DFD|nr:TetR/AcrR family transcriptional regulator C-terminal domain-containing protein [Streptomyces sp. MBT65]MBK3572810.1 TetR/AcrR family transcriptional regulator C-terminal domain-containing protein [Streptomyces sp. MBT65]
MSSPMPPTAGMPRDALHQEQIIQATIALLDESGIESLTMRRLGSRLGSSAAALYYHVRSRQDLLLLAADTVWGQTPLPAPDGAEWRPVLLAMADNLRSMLLRHPWLLAAMTIQPLDGPARDRHDEHLLAVCEASGLTRRDAEQAAQSVVTFAIGAALADTPRPYVSFGLQSLLDGVEARLAARA